MDSAKDQGLEFDNGYQIKVSILGEIMGLRDQVKGIIPDNARCSLSGHFNVIGDIAVLSLPLEVSVYARIIARAIISRHHNIRTVLNKTSRINGRNRTAHVEIIIGTDTVTTHHEYGFAYRLDVGTVFYDPRLASERKRVTDQVCPGERVLVPCCGVGPFVIPAAVHGAEIIALEQNPDACRWLAENVVLNGVRDRVTIITGDAFDRSVLPVYLFDRAIIPTPYGMDTIFNHIATRVKSGGMIHFYTFKNRNQAAALAEEFECNGYEVMFFRPCGNVAPSVSRWVFDVRKADTASRGLPGK
jgi:tRNA (guanine37-N1)-methyltransferase